MWFVFSLLGTTINFQPLWEAAKTILLERKIHVDPHILNHLNQNNGHGSMYTFHGLGWDHQDGSGSSGGGGGSGGSKFKIFIMYHNYNQLPKKYQQLAGKGGSEIASFCLPHGLLSFVYDAGDATSVVVETRLVMYPKEVEDARSAGLDVPSFTGTTALMFSDAGRDLIPLYDLERGRMCAWYSQFPR